MVTAATRSLEIAAAGLTPNSRISIGVISAPPPAPVMPTRKPMMALPRTMYGSMCMALTDGRNDAFPPAAARRRLRSSLGGGMIARRPQKQAGLDEWRQSALYSQA